MTLEELKKMGMARLQNRAFYPYYDINTYATEKLWDYFQTSDDQNKFLKLIWAWNNGYGVDPFQLAKIAPDFCPIFDTPLDYGCGLNRVFDPNVENIEGFFQPTIDHKIATINEGKNEISNMVVVCRKANTYKNDMHSKEILEVFYQRSKILWFN